MPVLAVQSQTTVIMQNGKVRLCKGNFTDSDLGKTTGNYDHNENYTLTLSVPGASSITLKFSNFCTEKDNDILRIFDGKDTFASLIGTYSGNKSPGTIKSTDSFITFHFISDKSVACSGWDAVISTVIIPPVAPKITMYQSAKCNDNFIIISSDKPIPCDSMKLANASMTGPIAIAPSGITAQNCNAGFATRFKIDLNGKLNLNGNYSFTAITYYKDYCDSVYKLTSKVNFSVADCPLKVVLTSDEDTLCKGTCTFLRAAVSGGNPAKYIYTWTPSGLSGAGPIKVCPTVSTRYILRVTDGISIPSADTVDIAVLDPPQAMGDTDVCYYSNNIFLRATPAGGKWFGKGIVNSTTGEFKPLGNYGINKVWYQLGTCADTVLVNSTLPWNLENVFCPGTASQALWWYGPTGGTWSGPKVTAAGIFTPDVPGTYKDTYTWKGCISVKTVYVQNIVVPRFDTACESITSDTLKFSPYGVYPNYFVGLTNSYYGWYNPSAMGGPQTKLIVWNGGGCKDSTYLTILASDAGPTDTFCPNAGVQILKNFRPTSGFTWSGHGIKDPTKAEYDPSFFAGLNKPSFRDTLTIKAGKCSDKKYVYLFPTIIGKKDTLFGCFETPAVNLNNLAINLSPKGGFWTGAGVSGTATFTPSVAGYGAHKLAYHKNGCVDSVVVYIRPKPIVQADTNVCIASSNFNCYAAKTGGTFSGKGITNAGLGTFNPSIAGRGVWPIKYTSKEGCVANFKITVDTVPVLTILNAQTDFCFRDTNVLLLANIAGGTFSGPGVNGNIFVPSAAGKGVHRITYLLKSGTC
ncbi:MAG: CUB domain-containing protein, partial [Bacteroidia bacterium]|nr:CUB domain-containing protein [Bacteroidia bacterium]